MKRREFIRLLGGGVAVWPLAARAQQPGRMRRIGILKPYAPTDMEVQARVRTFREELRTKGWATRVNVQFDERWTTDNMDLIRAAAANLAERAPDAILAVGGRVIPMGGIMSKRKDSLKLHGRRTDRNDEPACGCRT